MKKQCTTYGLIQRYTTVCQDLVSSLWSDVVLSWCYLENHSANQASLREREREGHVECALQAGSCLLTMRFATSTMLKPCILLPLISWMMSPEWSSPDEKLV